jgi:LCP family protein required for cell wall assembly
VRTKRRRKLKRKTPFIVTCLLLLVLLAGGGMLVKSVFFPGGSGGGGASVSDAGEEAGLEERLNVLLLGIDARSGETRARSDTMILASVDPESKQMCLLSIPRDTGVSIPGHGWDKINGATVYGGPELALKAVSNLLGTTVKYYVMTNFSGFKDVVDTLGGVTLNVEQNMYHWDPEDGGAYGINLKKGLQRLDGDEALQFVRYRKYDMADIDRVKNQQKFLAALAGEVLQPGTLPKLPKLVPVINRYVDTNLGLSDLYTLAAAARNLTDGDIVTQTLPGRPVTVNGLSYWGVNPSEARQTLAQLFKGEALTQVVLATPLDLSYLPRSAVLGPVEADAGQDELDEPEEQDPDTETEPGEPEPETEMEPEEPETDESEPGTEPVENEPGAEPDEPGTETGPGAESGVPEPGADEEGSSADEEGSNDSSVSETSDGTPGDTTVIITPVDDSGHDGDGETGFVLDSTFENE